MYFLCNVNLYRHNVAENRTVAHSTAVSNVMSLHHYKCTNIIAHVALECRFSVNYVNN